VRSRSTTPISSTSPGFFQHSFPHERSDLTNWRKRLGDKLELLLAESLRVAHDSGALRTKDLERVTVDTTVQPNAITFPTDAKLLHTAMVRLRQSYLRVAKHTAGLEFRLDQRAVQRSNAPERKGRHASPVGCGSGWWLA
jgi:hypothetical protein